MEDSKLQKLHDILKKLAPKGNHGGLGSRGIVVGGYKHKDNGLPKNGLYSYFVKPGHFKTTFKDSDDEGEEEDDKVREDALTKEDRKKAKRAKKAEKTRRKAEKAEKSEKTKKKAEKAEKSEKKTEKIDKSEKPEKVKKAKDSKKLAKEEIGVAKEAETESNGRKVKDNFTTSEKKAEKSKKAKDSKKKLAKEASGVAKKAEAGSNGGKVKYNFTNLGVEGLAENSVEAACARKSKRKRDCLKSGSGDEMDDSSATNAVKGKVADENGEVEGKKDKKVKKKKGSVSKATIENVQAKLKCNVEGEDMEENNRGKGDLDSTGGGGSSKVKLEKKRKLAKLENGNDGAQHLPEHSADDLATLTMNGEGTKMCKSGKKVEKKKAKKEVAGAELKASSSPEEKRSKAKKRSREEMVQPSTPLGDDVGGGEAGEGEGNGINGAAGKVKKSKKGKDKNSVSKGKRQKEGEDLATNPNGRVHVGGGEEQMEEVRVEMGEETAGLVKRSKTSAKKIKKDKKIAKATGGVERDESDGSVALSKLKKKKKNALKGGQKGES